MCRRRSVVGGYTLQLWLAGQLVSLVTIDVAAAPQFPPEPSASAMESDLDRVQADSQGVGDLLVREALLLTQDHNRSIARWKVHNVPMDAVVHFLSNQLLFHA